MVVTERFFHWIKTRTKPVQATEIETLSGLLPI